MAGSLAGRLEHFSIGESREEVNDEIDVIGEIKPKINKGYQTYDMLMKKTVDIPANEQIYIYAG